jgi:hypothetical protein
MISKNTVGRSPRGLVKICSSTPCRQAFAGGRQGPAAELGAQNNGGVSPLATATEAVHPICQPPGCCSHPATQPAHLVILVHQKPQLLDLLVLQKGRQTGRAEGRGQCSGQCTTRDTLTDVQTIRLQGMPAAAKRLLRQGSGCPQQPSPPPALLRARCRCVPASFCNSLGRARA